MKPKPLSHRDDDGSLISGMPRKCCDCGPCKRRFAKPEKPRCLAMIPECDMGHTSRPKLKQCDYRAKEGGPYCTIHGQAAKKASAWIAKGAANV